MDNTQINPGSAGDVIATDDVTTLNGAGSSGVKVQRVKVLYGDDGAARDVSDSFPLPVKAEAISKGVQSERGFSVQALKDGNRTLFSAATAIAGVSSVSTEAMLTLTPQRAGVAGTPGTSFGALNSEVRLRLTAIVVGIIASSAAVVAVRVSLRINPAGAADTASPIVLTIPVSSPPATAELGNEVVVPLPDGIEIAGAQQIGLSQVGSATSGTIWASIVGFEY